MALANWISTSTDTTKALSFNLLITKTPIYSFTWLTPYNPITLQSQTLKKKKKTQINFKHRNKKSYISTNTQPKYIKIHIWPITQKEVVTKLKKKEKTAIKKKYY